VGAQAGEERRMRRSTRSASSPSCAKAARRRLYSWRVFDGGQEAAAVVVVVVECGRWARGKRPPSMRTAVRTMDS
jgi:hypothetical protein